MTIEILLGLRTCIGDRVQNPSVSIVKLSNYGTGVHYLSSDAAKETLVPLRLVLLWRNA